MRNRYIFFILLFCMLISSCNIPELSKNNESQAQPAKSFIWDLSVFSSGPVTKINKPAIQETKPTATPQLIKPVNFEEAFSVSQYYSQPEIPQPNPEFAGGIDRAEWLYFSPSEFSSEPADTIFASFRNSGESVWSEKYHLDFYAGYDPSKEDVLPLSHAVSPGEQFTFEIPVTSNEPSWKACWQLKNGDDVSFYDFCYNHGSGINPQNAVSASSSQEESYSGVFWAFVKTEGAPPPRYSDSSLSAEFISTSPSSGHDFRAYDHYEELSVTFKNSGSEKWDGSYSLNFYSGYNWMHSNSFSLPNDAGPGETITITMPMEIFEDNDRWVTCWYLSTPDGKNLSDFCFNYTTSS